MDWVENMVADRLLELAACLAGPAVQLRPPTTGCSRRSRPIPAPFTVSSSSRRRSAPPAVAAQRPVRTRRHPVRRDTQPSRRRAARRTPRSSGAIDRHRSQHHAQTCDPTAAHYRRRVPIILTLDVPLHAQVVTITGSGTTAEWRTYAGGSYTTGAPAILEAAFPVGAPFTATLTYDVANVTLSFSDFPADRYYRGHDLVTAMSIQASVTRYRPIRPRSSRRPPARC
jgi:hypothetical protein